MKNRAISYIQIDNNLVRVTKYSFMPGQETGMHKHLYDYIVTPITDGKLLLIDKNGNESDYHLIASQSYVSCYHHLSEVAVSPPRWFPQREVSCKVYTFPPSIESKTPLEIQCPYT